MKKWNEYVYGCEFGVWKVFERRGFFHFFLERFYFHDTENGEVEGGKMKRTELSGEKREVRDALNVEWRERI